MQRQSVVFVDVGYVAEIEAGHIAVFLRALEGAELAGRRGIFAEHHVGIGGAVTHVIAAVSGECERVDLGIFLQRFGIVAAVEPVVAH